MQCQFEVYVAWVIGVNRLIVWTSSPRGRPSVCRVKFVPELESNSCLILGCQTRLAFSLPRSPPPPLSLSLCLCVCSCFHVLVHGCTSQVSYVIKRSVHETQACTLHVCLCDLGLLCEWIMFQPLFHSCINRTVTLHCGEGGNGRPREGDTATWTTVHTDTNIHTVDSSPTLT